MIFVRHALPGERVMIKITDDSKERFWRGDATEILQPSPDRVPAPCPISGPGGCGGCDFQHVDLAAQRRLKAAVLAEQLERLAGLELDVAVEEVPLPSEVSEQGAAIGPSTSSGLANGLGWRTRMRYLVDDRGRAGLRQHRSHRVIALPEEGCRIAAPGIARPADGLRGIGSEPAQDGTTSSESAGLVGELIGVAAADGTHWIGDESGGIGDESGPIVEHAAGRDWRVAGDGFWQVHPAAADTLVDAVLEGLAPSAGESAFDLYCGVGLFTGALIDAGCRVIGVEASRRAITDARHNLADAGSRARFLAARVDRALRQPRGKGSLPQSTDLVVLDPPRTGAGRAVVEQVVARGPRAIAYVACDPAALARDLAYFMRQGYQLANLRAFDLFPMTHHLECVATIVPR
ncbi:class I SAM-dependent RNA methyltransferase [Microlunatus elymi]|uniref:class I SAM-dependent RNA methyltransferase n=1 Tax=Microlunatus elymi TaxID=2596828 RepID=UPI002B1BD31D|nr:class I SAM-dependent RNA methyltransferase [Microlunatus elymi]